MHTDGSIPIATDRRHDPRAADRPTVRPVSSPEHSSSTVIKPKPKPKSKSEPPSKFRNLSERPRLSLGKNLPTVALCVVAVLLFGAFIFGVSSLFTDAFGGSPTNGRTNNPSDHYATRYNIGDDEQGNPYDDNDYGGDNPSNPNGYANAYDNEDSPYSEAPEQNDLYFNQANIVTAIQPGLEALATQLGLSFEHYEWTVILHRLAADVYHEYQDIIIDGVDWRPNIVSYAENAFMSSEWVGEYSTSNADDSNSNDTTDDAANSDSSDADSSDTGANQPGTGQPGDTSSGTPLAGDNPSESGNQSPGASSPTPTPQLTPSPQPTSPPSQATPPQATPTPRPQTATVTLPSGAQGQGISVQLANNQQLIDLFISDFQLRLAVNDPAAFPFNDAAMQNWAYSITATYREEGSASALTRLRANITALERADIEQQAGGQPTTPPATPPPATPAPPLATPAPNIYSINLNHFTPADAAFTLPTLSFRNRAVRDWFERNFYVILHNATPFSYLTGNHTPWLMLQNHVNSLSEDAALQYLRARAVRHAHQEGWTSATVDDFR